MHRSRLAGFIIDCQNADLDAAARFWSSALGMPEHGREDDLYAGLDASARDLAIEVQRVEHPSRLHLDIETDDLDAEAARLEALGATRIGFVKRWWVMEAPTGQRFCIVKAKRSLDGAPGANVWP
jgi:catechol 2,3-dioxygenase-like lactoylglutathione lyase family enzyme